jgi:hypothetical protein
VAQGGHREPPHGAQGLAIATPSFFFPLFFFEKIKFIKITNNKFYFGGMCQFFIGLHVNPLS